MFSNSRQLGKKGQERNRIAISTEKSLQVNKIYWPEIIYLSHKQHMPVSFPHSTWLLYYYTTVGITPWVQWCPQRDWIIPGTKQKGYKPKDISGDLQSLRVLKLLQVLSLLHLRYSHPSSSKIPTGISFCIFGSLLFTLSLI